MRNTITNINKKATNLDRYIIERFIAPIRPSLRYRQVMDRLDLLDRWVIGVMQDTATPSAPCSQRKGTATCH